MLQQLLEMCKDPFQSLPPSQKSLLDIGSRVLHIIVSRKLDPITTLSGDEFLFAWWEVVKYKYPVLFVFFIINSLL
jgi:hypothetical protein